MEKVTTLHAQQSSLIDWEYRVLLHAYQRTLGGSFQAFSALSVRRLPSARRKRKRKLGSGIAAGTFLSSFGWT